MQTPKINSVFQGRSFLAEKDFTPAEIQYLVDFAIHLKALKKNNIPHHYLEGKISPYFLLKLLHVRVLHLQQQLSTLVLTQNILVKMIFNLVSKNLLKIQHVFLAQCLMRLNVVVSHKRS